MTNLKFIKTLTAGVALTMALYPQAWAATSGTCGENCTWEIADGELKIQGTGNINDYYYENSPWYGQRGSITKITIDEGITSIGETAFYKIPATSISLPSTLKSIGNFAFRESSLTSINLPQGLESVGAGAFACPVSSIEFPASIKHIGGLYTSGKELIFNANNNVVFNAGYASDITDFSGSSWDSVNVKCKGKKDDCQRMLANVAQKYANAGKDFTISYYTGLNEDGNWEIWSDDGVALYSDSTLQKPLGKYDFEGNQTGIYKYDGAGNLTAAYENGVSTYKRTSYTPAEAAAAIKKGNNNKITFTFK